MQAGIATIAPPTLSQPEVQAGRVARPLIYAPTALSAWLLAACMFLPFGVYGGCNSPNPRVLSPVDRQREAVAKQDSGDLIVVSLPYGLALMIGVGTVAVCLSSRRNRFLWLWILYAGLIVLSCVLLVVVSVPPNPDSSLLEFWQQHGMLFVTLLWLLNVVWATWLAAPCRFIGAMLLQGVLLLLIGFGLLPWLLFLEELRLGGWLTAICAIVLPLGTGLQMYGDPAACRESSRTPDASGMPQFTLLGLLTITTLLAAILATCQAWSFEAAMLLTYVATMTLLAARSRKRIAAGGWYASVAAILAVGGWLAL